ncbi:MAG: glycosyltransferase family 39 protein [Chloroflexi bacterium]|nr:glycosyltransferase family 39 protein [Chloroflexota bacterium]OJV96607.1 MAG: hypothetical protein BGO39_10140 [Chloroflexi bacterium 54-19]
MNLLKTPVPANLPVDVSPETKTRRKEIILIISFLAVAIGVKLLLGLYLWRNGFVEYDTDGFTRSIIAWQWEIGKKQLGIDAWLPLQFWLNGTLMHFWPDLLRVPRLVNMLSSIVTTVNLFFIGRALFGRNAGFVSAALAAIFPWEIWFGLSGMSESLTHVFLTTGVVFFTQWLTRKDPRAGWLVLASLGFLGATMLRYEAWFYSAVYALIALVIALRRNEWGKPDKIKVVLALVPAFIFMAGWMYASWTDPAIGSPLGFAKITSEINGRIYNSENTSMSFFSRLVFYPQTFLTLWLPLTLPAIAGSLWLAWKPVGKARWYLALVWGEFVVFILTTLPFNNIAPGSARYPVSNLLLLLPVVAYLFERAFTYRAQAVRYAGVGLVALLLLSQVYATLERPRDYPDEATRQVAVWLNKLWKTGYLKPDEKVMLDLPASDGPQGNDFTRAYYSLPVLTNHPDSFVVPVNFDTFSAMVMSQTGGAPHVWVHLASAGGDLKPFKNNYRDVETFGDYTVGTVPIFRGAAVLPGDGIVGHKGSVQSGQPVTATADEYKPKETTAIWVTRPDKKVINLGNKDADTNGVLSISYTPDQAIAGDWSITIVGMESGRRAVGMFEVK